MLNDVVIAVRALRARDRLRRVAIVDLDVHQGNGTHALCAGDEESYTFSMHGRRNYPFRKVAGRLDVELEDGTGDALGRLHLTFDGLMRRDAYVLETARAVGVPVVIVVAGGYGRDLSDTVQVHRNTARVADSFL